MNPRTSTITGMILMAALARALPHPWNITPIGAIALFGGATFNDRRLAFLVPLAAMFLSDLPSMRFHALTPVVYACFAAIVVIGFALRGRRSPGRIAAASVASSVFFYLVTNFAVWASRLFAWPPTPAGLTACYIAGLPLLRQTLLGDAFYTALLFGAFALAEQRFPRLREETA